MSIAPPSDIVTDVVNAADPFRSANAAQRLAKLAQTKKTSEIEFSKFVQATATRSQPAKSFNEKETHVAIINNDLLATSQRAKTDSHMTDLKKAHQKLESIFLQGIITSMLSNQQSKIYGKGIAGSYWKSFMAEAIANQVASGKSIGIAESLSGQGKSGVLSRNDQSSAISNRTDYRHFLQKIFLDELAAPSTSS